MQKNAVVSFVKDGGEKLKIYPLGIEKQNVFSRPAFSLIVGLKRSPALKIKREDDSFAVSDVSKSEYSEFMENLEERFAKLDPNAMIVLLDIDEYSNRLVKNREQEDTFFARMLGQKILRAASSEENAKQIKIPVQEVKDLEHAFLRCDFPYNFSMDVVGGRRIGLIVPGNPNAKVVQRIKDWTMGDVTVKDNLPITRKQLHNVVIYHEIAHSLDAEIGQKTPEGKTELEVRMKEESLADSFAILQMIRDDKNTDFAKVFSDLRLVMVAANVEGMAKKNASPEPMFSYFSSPVINQTIAFAEEKLKDGSLEKMSDKDVFKLAQDITKKHLPTLAQVKDISSGMLGKGENPDYISFKESLDSAKERVSAPANENRDVVKESHEEDLWLRKTYLELANLKEEDTSAIFSFVNKTRNEIRAEKLKGAENIASETADALLKYPYYVLAAAADYKNALKVVEENTPTEEIKKPMESFVLGQKLLVKSLQTFAANPSPENAVSAIKAEALIEKAATKLNPKQIADRKLALVVEEKAQKLAPQWVVNFVSAANGEKAFFDDEVMKKIIAQEKRTEIMVTKEAKTKEKNVAAKVAQQKAFNR